MLAFVKWLLARIGDITQLALSFKVIGGFSLLHFILGYNLLILLLRFLRFGNDPDIEDIGGLLSFRNSENKRDRKSNSILYDKETGSIINNKTGESYQPKHIYRPKHRKES